MLFKRYKSEARTLAVLGMLLSALMAAPVCIAGGAAAIVPAADSDVPQGNRIPQHRVDAIERQVSEFNAQAQSAAERQDSPSTSN